MHLVGFIIRIYHDARSHERQNCDMIIIHIIRRNSEYNLNRIGLFVHHLLVLIIVLRILFYFILFYFCEEFAT